MGNTSSINYLINDNKIFNKDFLHKGDLLDTVSLNNIINSINPNEIYNFADQDHVAGVMRYHHTLLEQQHYQ